MHYNFVRIHQSLRITPAMAAGVTSKLWSLTDMVRLIGADAVALDHHAEDLGVRIGKRPAQLSRVIGWLNEVG